MISVHCRCGCRQNAAAEEFICFRCYNELLASKNVLVLANWELLRQLKQYKEDHVDRRTVACD